MFINTCACEACDLLKMLFLTFNTNPACTVLRENIHGLLNLEELEKRLRTRKVLQYRMHEGGMVLVDVETNLVVELIDLPPHYLEPSQVREEEK
jgi:hypothetical protein